MWTRNGSEKKKALTAAIYARKSTEQNRVEPLERIGENVIAAETRVRRFQEGHNPRRVSHRHAGMKPRAGMNRWTGRAETDLDEIITPRALR